MKIRELQHLVEAWLKNGWGDLELEVYEPVIDKEYRPVLGFSFCTVTKRI